MMTITYRGVDGSYVYDTRGYKRMLVLFCQQTTTAVPQYPHSRLPGDTYTQVDHTPHCHKVREKRGCLTCGRAVLRTGVYLWRRFCSRPTNKTPIVKNSTYSAELRRRWVLMLSCFFSDISLQREKYVSPWKTRAVARWLPQRSNSSSSTAAERNSRQPPPPFSRQPPSSFLSSFTRQTQPTARAILTSLDGLTMM